MKNTFDLITLRKNFFRQMNDFVNKNGSDGEIIAWNNLIVGNTLEQIATAIAQDDDLWFDMCAFFGELIE